MIHPWFNWLWASFFRGFIGSGHGFTMVSLPLDVILYGLIGFGHGSAMVSLALDMVLSWFHWLWTCFYHGFTGFGRDSLWSRWV